jgi:putative nucleotidyltransferase with HDIG domain
LYITAVVLAGVLAVGTSVYDLAHEPFRAEWLILAALTLLTGSFSIKLPSVDARISVSEAFVFAAVLLFGPAVATIVVALDTIVLTSWTPKARRLPARAFFNVSAGATAIWISSHLFTVLLPSTETPPQLEQLLVPVLALALSYFAINSALIAIAVGHDRTVSPFYLWQRNFAWLSLNYLGGASVATLLVAYRRNIDLTALSVIVPLMVITYLTFRTSLGRLEDAQNHVVQLNDLYMSTIEALAMAVDAKDQITHGHIRRVQVYATELAKRLGVTDQPQIQAIAAAALLHDMGKLAIPEHILNKPGKLTAAEFDKMKRHADIGADLLSSIKFPYPVVPIVRHHHESWNGHGYPAGISGTDIPLGARILSVVDCFDALTSDRPYRPRLSSDEAFDIIRQRRGSMYDPLIVDTFISAYPQIAPMAARAGQEARTILAESGFMDKTADELALNQIRANATETVLLDNCAHRIAQGGSLENAFETVTQVLRQLTPATVWAFYRYDAGSDSLVCESTTGDIHNYLHGLIIPLAERVTGWTGANRRTSMNSDASLDLAHIARLFTPPLHSTLALPLTEGERLLGVLTGYSTREAAFNDAHRYSVERIGILLSERIRRVGSSTVISFPARKS